MKKVPARPFNPRRLRQLFDFLQPSMYFRKEDFLKVGGLDIETQWAMDWELVLKFLNYTGAIHPIPEDISRLRMYETTKTATGGWPRYEEIAKIGREQNGRFDLNYISFNLRTKISLVKAPLAKKILRFAVDSLCQAMARGDLYMVCQWPDELEKKE